MNSVQLWSVHDARYSDAADRDESNFPVADMGQSVSFYRSLGFEVEAYGPGYAWVRHSGDEILHLALVPELDLEANHAAVYFHVQDVAEWHSAWSASVPSLTPIEDCPWEMREFRLTDPSGNLLRVGQNL